VSLGKFEGDYKNLTLSWMLYGRVVTLKGDRTLGRSQASGKMALNALRNDEEGFLVTPLFRFRSKEQHSISTATMNLLQQFDDIFQPPSELLPQRTHDHKKVLKENAPIPHIWPYRFPH